MRYYATSVSRYNVYYVTPDTTEKGIRLGYQYLCNVLGMAADKRKSDRTAAEQRAVSGYGHFIRQVLSKGSEVWNPVFTVSDLNRGVVCVFIVGEPPATEKHRELTRLADLINFDWKPPFERTLDRLALARTADMSKTSDALNRQTLDWLIKQLPIWELLLTDYDQGPYR